MNVLMINGSPHKNGLGRQVLSIISEELSGLGISSRIYDAADFNGGGCRACRACKTGSGCVLGDLAELSEIFMHASGIIISSPVYYASPSGTLISLLDRLFQSTKFDKRMKVGAAFVTARRGGCTASLDALYKYFAISEMPIATSNYWNLIHTEEDKEGERTARILAKNMAFLMKSIELGSSQL